MDFDIFFKNSGLLVGDVIDDTLASILESCPISPAWDTIGKQPANASSNGHSHGFDFGGIAAMLQAEAQSSSSSVGRVPATPDAGTPVKMEQTEDMDTQSSEANSPSSQSESDYEEPATTKAAPKSKAAARDRSKKASKRKWSRSHTRKEPTVDEFGTQEDYEQAWKRWRELRDNNNNAVKRSRENKKKLLPTQCRQQRCIHLHNSLEALQKKMNLLVKAIRAPSSLSAHERREYDSIITA